MTQVAIDNADVRESFSAALRSATWSAHRLAQASPFMDDLLAGSLDRSRYAHLVAQYYFIYDALEQAERAMREDPVVKAFLHPGLERLPAIRADMAFLLGPDWSEQIAPTDETVTYCARLDEVCYSWPGAFIAHHYVRYMGDLSGGQHIGALVRRVYCLEGDGARFYAFDGLPDPDAFKTNYREQLDLAPWTNEEREQVIKEALVAYELNTLVLSTLR